VGGNQKVIAEAISYGCDVENEASCHEVVKGRDYFVKVSAKTRRVLTGMDCD